MNAILESGRSLLVIVSVLPIVCLCVFGGHNAAAGFSNHSLQLDGRSAPIIILDTIYSLKKTIERYSKKK